MKTILIAVLMIAGLPVRAATIVRSPSLSKTADGKVLLCRAPEDVNRYGYRPTLYGVREIDARSVRVSLSLAALICKRTAGGFEFDIRRMNDPVPTTLPNGAAGELRFTHQDAVLYTSDLDILGRLDTANEMIQTFDYDLPLSSFMDVRELASLESGRRVTKTLGFHVRSSTVVATRYGEIAESSRAGGAYELTFTLEAAGGRVKVLEARLR